MAAKTVPAIAKTASAATVARAKRKPVLAARKTAARVARAEHALAAMSANAAVAVFARNRKTAKGGQS